MKLIKDIYPAKNYILEKTAPEKKDYFSEKPISGLDRKTEKSKNSSNQKNQEEITAYIGKSAISYLHPSVYTATYCSHLNAYWKQEPDQI